MSGLAFDCVPADAGYVCGCTKGNLPLLRRGNNLSPKKRSAHPGRGHGLNTVEIIAFVEAYQRSGLAERTYAN